MQLSRARRLARAGALVALIAPALPAPGGVAHAEDRAEASTTLFEERRAGGLGGLTVVHPQADVGVDLGRHVELDAGYAADAVSGATATIYQVDAVSTATTFHDLRHQADLGVTLKGARSRLSLGASAGTERDYGSLALGGTAQVDLPGRNTTIAIAYGHALDRVCERDNGDATPLQRQALTGADPCVHRAVIFGRDTPGQTRWAPLAIDTAQVTLTQNLSPTANLQVALFGQVLQGEQGNPYRRVRVGPAAPLEHLPDTRARWSLTARANRFLPALRAAAHVDARAYNDTWGVTSGAVELGYSQHVGTSLLLHLRARVSQQTAATFFKDAFFYETESTAGAYFTGDRELSPVRDALLGGKLTLVAVGEERPVWGLFDKLQLNLKGDVLLLDELPADDAARNAGGRARQFLYGGGALDAVVVALGLVADY